MQPERWSRLEQLYHAALEQEEDQRAAFLERSCADDDALRREVESLIAYGQRSGGIIDKPALEVVAALVAENLPTPDSGAGDKLIGTRIAQYQIVEKLGAGGMGDVYRAVRADNEYDRHVALKLIRAGSYSAFFVNRFRNERQILASLDHPNIARLYDGGTTGDSVPYFVMELIEGEPLVAYCDNHRLSTIERVRLFLQVCSAVQYAHQHLIIHRDIKPDNILVTAEGVAKLMDFGIAKILDTDTDAAQSDLTVTGLRAFTIGYASPEQIKGEPITTASDVYSLGVVLYELLTGHSPYRITSRAQHDMARAICEADPDKPSTAAGHPGQTLDSDGNVLTVTPEWVSSCRNTSPDKLRRTLCGDLDQILLKALRKESQRRYGSAQDFANDLQSYTLGLPVSARSDTFSYRSGKFIRRNKISLTAAAVFVLIVMAGAVAIMREARIARMQEARAEQRFESLRKLTNSLLFEFHDSIENLPGSTSARELVVRRALEYLEQIATEAHDDPATLRDLAAAYERIGRIQSEEGHPHTGGAGAFQDAKELYEKALTIRQKLAASHPADLSLQLDLVGTMLMVARMYEQLGALDQSLHLQQQRLEIEERLQAQHDSEELRYNIAASLIGIGALKVWLGDYESAHDYEQRALAISQGLLDANPGSLRARRSLWRSHGWSAWALKFDRRFAQAADEYRKGLAISEQLAAQDPNNTDYQRLLISDNGNLCESLAYAGSFSEVRSHCQRAIAINEEMVKSDKKNVQALADLANSNMTMGLALYLMHSPREALVFEQRAASMYHGLVVRDPDPLSNAIDNAESLIYLGRVEADLHRPVLARKDLEQAQEILEQLAKRSPQNRYYVNSLDEARAALKALPHDTAPIAVH
jgi:non-specific serine/threonine protein kinase/serine/threonine-protein kinase